jgi:hypothetical protein
MRIRAGKQLRVLDLDIENRPISYLGPDFTTCDITAIAWSWYDRDEVEVWLLGLVPQKMMLEKFVENYDKCDIATGHYLRKHDLPIINGALLEHGLPILSEKLTSDTKLDLVKRAGISASQENLAEMYSLPHAKQHMSQIDWRAANRLTPEGIEGTRRRVVDDVIQHKALRRRLIEAGALGPPRIWRP